MTRYKMDFHVFISEIYFISIIFLSVYNVESALTVTVNNISATGIENGLSATFEFSGVTQIICFIAAENEEEVEAFQILESDPKSVETSFTQNGFYDLSIFVFADMDLVLENKENFYIGSYITGIDISNNTTGSVIPYHAPLVADIDFTFSFSTGTDVNSTISLSDGWTQTFSNQNNGSYSVSLPKEKFVDSGLYTVDVNFTNPLSENGILRSAVLAVQAPVADAEFLLTTYDVASVPVYVMVGQEFNVSITLGSGEDVLFSLLVEQDTSTKDLKGNFCEGQIRQNIIPYTFELTGSYKITIEISNYVSYISQPIEFDVIHEVDFTLDISPLVSFSTEDVSFIATVNEPADLPMGTVICGVDYGDNSTNGSMTFDMTPVTAGDLSKTTDTLTKMYPEGWYDVTIMCTNQLPYVVNTFETFKSFRKTVKVVNELTTTLQLTHDIANLTYHPFTDTITFTIKQTSTSDPTYANVTCEMNINDGSTDSKSSETGDITNTSSITLVKSFSGGKDYTISVNCSNLKSFQVLPDLQFHVYFNCWTTDQYFDSSFKSPNGFLQANTNEELTVKPNVRLTGNCHGTVKHYWTLYKYESGIEIFQKNLTSESATIINLGKFTVVDAGTYKFELSIYFESDQYEEVPMLRDYIDIKYSLAPLVVVLKMNNSVNSIETMRLDNVNIDSGESSDPSESVSDTNALNRVWECRTGTGLTKTIVAQYIGSDDLSVWPAEADIICTGNLQQSAVNFVVDQSKFKYEQYYLFSLKILHSATSRSSTKAHALYFVQDDPLNITLNCLSCPDKSSGEEVVSSIQVLPLKDLEINCVVLTPGIYNNTLDYSWTFQQLVDGAYVDKSHLIETGSSSGFKLTVESLSSLRDAQPEAQYIVTSTVKATGFADTSSDFIFAINQPPYAGTCAFDPQPEEPVTASITIVGVRCTGWKDENKNAKRNAAEDSNTNVKYAASQVYLTQTGEVNKTITPNDYDATANTRLEFRLLKSPDDVNITNVKIRVYDHLKAPFTIVDLGNLQISPAVPNDASGPKGVEQIEEVLESAGADLEAFLELKSLDATGAITSIANSLPNNPPVNEVISVENDPDTGGVFTKNADGEPISPNDLFDSYAKKEDDPTVLKAREVMVTMADALRSTALSQSPETKKSPEAQQEVVKTMSTFAGAAKHLTKKSKEIIADVASDLFSNTKDVKTNDPDGEDFVKKSLEMAANVASAMTPPELKDVNMETDLEAERQRTMFESQFMSKQTQQDFEGGKLSQDEVIYYKSLDAKRKANEVNSMRTLCNNYSKSKTDYEENIIHNMQLSDGSVKAIISGSSKLVVTSDIVEKLNNIELNTTGTIVKLNGLNKLNPLQKAKIALVEQSSVSHIDDKGFAGKVVSGEKTLLIETDGDIPGTIQTKLKVPMVELEKIPLVVDEDDASQFTYFQAYVSNTYDDLNVNIEPDIDSPNKILKFGVNILYCDVKDLDTKYVSELEYTAKKEINEASGWVAKFTPRERLEKAGIYKIGVRTVKDESAESQRISKRSAILTQNETIKFGTATMACMTWDETRQEWRSDECTGTWKPSTGELECDCKPKKKLTFANSFYVAPNKIDFGSVFLKFSPLNQAAVMAVLILIFIIYILIIIWTRRQDRKDLLKWGITPLSDNFLEDNYFYVIKVFTGMRPGAGTKSRICMVICGEEMDSGVRELYDGVREEFSTGSVMNFLMSTTVYLGDLDYIRIWHDNSGGGSYASWYLSRIEVHDVQRNESFSFLGGRWLAVEKEDGLLECILPVCKAENLNVFKNRFFLNAKDNLADSHIWISVAYRPQVSNFTRTQRASCALLFVMLTMIANAMFFRGSNEDNYETPAELQVGPFRFSLQQIYISFVCALIVTPGTLLVIYLFKLSKVNIDPNETLYKPNDKASRYKIPFMKEWLENEQRRSMELEQHLVQKGLPNMQGLVLPHWCRNLAWFIVVVTTFICAFFIMLFSMQWGKQKSEEWITTFLLSFFESVFCLDPVKVGFMALILAIIFRSTKDSHAPVSRSTIMKRYSSSLRGKSKGLRLPAPPLDEKKLEKAREEKNRDMLMKKALRDIVVNIIIIWILFSISFSNRDSMSYYMHKRVVDTFLEPANMPSFTSIKTTSDFFDWMQKTAIINGFPEYEKDANNTPLHWRMRQFTEGGTHFRVGPPRLRQLRTTKKSCTNSPFPSVNCYKKYYETSEETASYCIGWKNGPCHPDEAIYNFTSEAWKFTSAFDIWGMPISGYYTTYGGGGYISKLSVNRKVSEAVLNELFRNSWVDRQTRAVIFEFTLYCLNANIFTYNMFMVEFPETGGAIPFYMILPMRVFLHQGPLGLYTLVCEVLFVLYLIILTVMMIVQMYQQKKDYFKQGWQVFDMVFIIFGYVAIAMNIIQIVFTNMSLEVFREDKKAFVNFYHLALWNTILVLLIGLLVFMATVRMLNILGYNKRIGAVAKVFTKAASDLLWFGLFFSYVFVCYAAFGFLLFGWKLKSYKNVFKTMGTLFISMIGKSRFTEIEETDPVFSKVYFMCFIFFVVYMILTMFLAVLSKAIDQVHEDTKRDKSEEMVDYCIKKLKGLLSYNSGTKKGTVKPAPWNRVDHKVYQRGQFSKSSNREILQEIRETMNEALAGNPRDFSTPDSECNKRRVKFRR